MTFSEAVKTCFSKYSEFSGRARPSEYWWWVLFSVLVQTVTYVLLITVLATGGDSGSMTSVVVIIWVIVWAALLLPSLSVLVRRFHDTGKSGWFFFLGLIPLVGPIILIVFLVTAGDPGANQYGDAPA